MDFFAADLCDECYEREYSDECCKEECCEDKCYGKVCYKEECRKEECYEEAPIMFSKKRKAKKKKAKSSSASDGDFDDDNDVDSSPESVKPPVEEEIDKSKVWNEEVAVSDVIRLQSRDGFWDLPSLFVTKKLEGKPIEVPGVDLSASPIVKKRVVSTVFTLAYLEKFFGENTGRWRFAKEKALKWLKRIESSVNWEQVINGVIPSITK